MCQAGPITFHALIKRGDPNTGEFYYPNSEQSGKLVLQESKATAEPGLHLAARGESCSVFCAARKQVCAPATMRRAGTASADGLMAMLEPIKTSSAGVLSALTCRPPLLQSCSTVAPAVNPATGQCWFYRKDSRCTVITNSQPPSSESDLSSLSGCGGLASDSGEAVCDITPRDMDVRRLCACKAAPAPGRARRANADDATQRHTTNQSTGAKDPNDSTARNSTDLPAKSSGAGAAPRAASLRSLVAGTALAMAFFGPADAAVAAPASTAATALTALLVASVPWPAAAHNWLHTPSRSRFKASSTKPCIPRKASDTHQQVGPGQTFAVKWATGHAGDGSARCIGGIADPADPKCIAIGKEYTSISIIRAEDYVMLGHEKFSEMLEEYVVEAPSSNSKHLHAHWQRYHGIKPGSCGNCDGQ